MSDRTSRRGFMGIAAGALAGLTGTFSRAFGHDDRAGHEGTSGRDEEARRLAAPLDRKGDLVATRTYDRHARLIAVSRPDDSATTTFVYPHA